MHYRTLGGTGEKVSVLGFGCMRLPTIGGDEGVIDEKEATKMLQYAVEHGVNFVDTAYTYHRGNSELWLGKALKGGLREKVLLATKLPSWKVESRDDHDKFLNEQLERLQTEYLDFYLVHSLIKDWWRKVKELGVLEFLDAAIRDGRIRFAAFSFHDDYPVFEEIVDAYDWSFCLVQHNYMDEEYQAGTKGVKYAAGKGLGVVVMEPLRGGKLAASTPADIQAIWDTAEVRRSPAEWALRWVWDKPEVSALLSGMSSMPQLEENVAIASRVEPNSLSAQELDLIARVREKMQERLEVPCTLCNYCVPCPNGVNIPKIFSLYNEAVVYKDRMGPSYCYQNMLNAGEQATSCIECEECEEACPQKIPIIDKLKESHTCLSN